LLHRRTNRPQRVRPRIRVDGVIPLREVAAFEVADEACARVRPRRTPTMTGEPDRERDRDDTDDCEQDERVARATHDGAPQARLTGSRVFRRP
jgi:hypothetical protein